MSDIIKNKACVEMEMCGKVHVLESNTVEAKKINIEISKSQNCDFCFTGDILQYTIKIYNDSDVDLCEVEFIDDFEGTEFMGGSFRVDGRRAPAQVIGNQIRYLIQELKAKKEMFITFDARVC